MVDKNQLVRLREKLMNRRKELIDSRQNLTARWQQLQEGEVEVEETAQKVSLSQAIEQLDEQEKGELNSIDRSLARMETGTYGMCTGCGNDISFKRLEIIPHTNLCSQCALKNEIAKRSTTNGVTLPVAEEGPSIDYERLSNKELKSAIYDALERDGRIALEELEIICRAGTVYLKGALPGRKQHRMLLQVLEDVMGLNDVVDDVQIDRLLWERWDRTKGIMEQKKTEEEVMLEGEDIDEDTFHSKKTGMPVSPPDTLLLEREK